MGVATVRRGIKADSSQEVKREAPGMCIFTLAFGGGNGFLAPVV
jgi:hypothetical protein